MNILTPPTQPAKRDPYLLALCKEAALKLIEETSLNESARAWNDHATNLAAQLYDCAEQYVVDETTELDRNRPRSAAEARGDA